MTVTVGVPSDSRLAPLWPTSTVPEDALEEWLTLQLALRGSSTPCQGPDGEWWFAGRRTQAEAGRQDAARVACGWCPVLVQCRAYAVAAGEADGVWGGLTSAERKAAQP